tara:strand:- start:675 stop:1442 length:768 start_codon:yes stop_codon:yes gene_type:complete
MIKPKILITNDDGISSEGIYALWDAMQDVGETFIAAPSIEKSATSHSLTLSDPLRANIIEREHGFKGWSISGTPVDCVKLAIRSLMGDRPDVLISGINHGANLGNNIMYSGTVSAAAEGMIMGIPSIAISLASYETDNYDVSKKFAKKIVEKVIANGIPKDILLNVNVPYCNEDEIKGVRITRQGSQYFVDEFEERIDPRNGNYFWIKGKMIDEDKSIEFDGAAIKENYVSITPIHYRLTNESFFNDLKNQYSDD